ncbi:MAG: molybdopterin adenylyltransferase [Deltaproteobacteria bacterium]|nr:molybdopterin adenylyltransferase [Deltaproteobacteria bacterium]
MSNEVLKVGIITVSDRAYNGVYEDQGGPAIKDWLLSVLVSRWESIYEVVPDEKEQIEDKLIRLCDKEACDLILTTGGTGPAERDVTPDATLAVADRVMDGFGERMRMISLKYVPTAILSRQIGVIRKKSLIINLPGQPKAIKETLDELFEAIPYCIELMDGPIIKTNEEIVKAFRPKSALKNK